MLAPLSQEPSPSDSGEDIRARVRETLCRLERKAQTGRLNSDSTLFKIKTRMGTPADAARRARFLEEHDAADPTATLPLEPEPEEEQTDD